MGRSERGGSRRLPAMAACMAALAALLGACGGGGGGSRSLTWYINPDDGGQKEIASRCSAASNGAYRIVTSLLPNSASAQREQLVRRLAAKDGSIDLMSLDPPFVPEAAQAGFLRPFTAEEARPLSDGVIPGAVQGATWRDQLVAAPFWANTQLLWYRKSVAAKTGLDPADQPVNWDQIVASARQTNTTVAVQAKRYEGYVVWINALVASAGGAIVENPEAPSADTRLGLESPAGERAAEIIHNVATSGVAGPSLSTSDEESARALFQGPTGGFMVNWPYVWRAANKAAQSGSLAPDVLADIGWARYPQAIAGTESAPPLGGIAVGIGAYSKHQDLAVQAVNCITSQDNQKYYFLHDGNPPARSAVFDDAEVRQEFPMAPVIKESLTAAVPRPTTPFYSDISSALQRTWHAPSSVDPARTPAASTDLILGVVRGEKLL